MPLNFIADKSINFDILCPVAKSKVFCLLTSTNPFLFKTKVGDLEVISPVFSTVTKVAELFVYEIQPFTDSNIEEDLTKEIPKFLKLLIDLPKIDFSVSRMVFTKEEIKTNALDSIKNESKSSLCKEIEYHLDYFFNNYNINEFEATAGDIKNKWFLNNNQISISYIRKVIKEEMKIETLKVKKYLPFNDHSQANTMVTGAPFYFYSNIEKEQIIDNQNDIILNNHDIDF